MAERFITRYALLGLALIGAAVLCGPSVRAETPTIHVDYAYYNPVSLVLKRKHWLEDALGAEGSVEWVQSAGSNKALEFLNAGSLDFGSTAGAAALLGRANGNPIKSI
jgi:sulfonate transport system substrate-binding protein